MCPVRSVTYVSGRSRIIDGHLRASDADALSSGAALLAIHHPIPAGGNERRSFLSLSLVPPDEAMDSTRGDKRGRRKRHRVWARQFVRWRSGWGSRSTRWRFGGELPQPRAGRIAHPAAGGPAAANHIGQRTGGHQRHLAQAQVSTHWSARRLAKEVGLSPATVHRIWQKYGLQPHRVETFKFSYDPEFEAKLADIVGLYLDPPERAMVLCVDEKSQIQALNRTQRARCGPDCWHA